MNTIFLCNVVNNIATFIEAILPIIFVSSFMGEKFNKKQIRIAIITVLFIYFFIVVFDSIALFSIFKVIVSFSAMLIGLFYIYNRDYDRIILLKTIDLLSMILIETILTSIIAYTFGKSVNYMLNDSMYRAISIIIICIVKIIYILCIKKVLIGNKMLRKKSTILMLVFSAGILFFTMYMYSNVLKVNKITFSQMVVFIILLFMEILVIFSISILDDNYNKIEEIALVELNSDILYKSLEEEKQNFEIWRNRVHDYKNHVIYMRQLLEKKDYKRMKKLMDDEIGELQQQSYYIKTGYIGIDAIINSKLMFINGKGLHAICNINLPDDLIIDDTAMASILGNLLDNAIRSAIYTEKKYLEIKIAYKMEILHIKISNSTSLNNVNFNESSKSDKRKHGIGLNSVNNSIKKLKGAFKIKQNGEVVDAVVNIPIKRKNDHLGK